MMKMHCAGLVLALLLASVVAAEQGETPIQLSVTLGKGPYYADAPIAAKVTLTNTGNRPFSFERLRWGVGWHGGYEFVLSPAGKEAWRHSPGVPLDESQWRSRYYFPSDLEASEECVMVEMFTVSQGVGPYKVKARIQDGETLYESAEIRFEVLALPQKDPIRKLLDQEALRFNASEICITHYTGRKAGRYQERDALALRLVREFPNSVCTQAYTYSYVISEPPEINPFRERELASAVEAGEKFLQLYPESAVRADVCAAMTYLYARAGDEPKARQVAEAGRALEVKPVDYDRSVEYRLEQGARDFERDRETRQMVDRYRQMKGLPSPPTR